MSLDAPDEALVQAMDTPSSGPLTAEELARSAATSVAVIDAIVREGLLHPVTVDPTRFDAGDLATVRAGVALIDAGLPLGELLDLAGRADRALRDLATHAVDVFLAFVRDPARATADDEAAAARLLHAYNTMLPAAAELVGGHFRGLVLEEARRRAEDVEG